MQRQMRLMKYSRLHEPTSIDQDIAELRRRYSLITGFVSDRESFIKSVPTERLLTQRREFEEGLKNQSDWYKEVRGENIPNINQTAAQKEEDDLNNLVEQTLIFRIHLRFVQPEVLSFSILHDLEY